MKSHIIDGSIGMELDVNENKWDFITYRPDGSQADILNKASKQQSELLARIVNDWHDRGIFCNNLFLWSTTFTLVVLNSFPSYVLSDVAFTNSPFKSSLLAS